MTMPDQKDHFVDGLLKKFDVHEYELFIIRRGHILASIKIHVFINGDIFIRCVPRGAKLI